VSRAGSVYREDRAGWALSGLPCRNQRARLPSPAALHSDVDKLQRPL